MFSATPTPGRRNIALPKSRPHHLVLLVASPLNDVQRPAVVTAGRSIKVCRRHVLPLGSAKGSAVGHGQQCRSCRSSRPSGKKPNIVFIMGDDVGWFNIGAYHRGIMSGKTPNLDRLAREGMLFTDYYAEASCTAGRANFITGEIPLRTGLTTVGQAGADVGMPAQACTIATALKAQGYATGQFGKNHLGDLNKYLPTLHGFDEFFGYLYHLDAMSDPFWYSYPADPKFFDTYGPRNLVHCWATDKDDDDRDAALGQGRQAEDRRRRPVAAVPEHGRTASTGRPAKGSKYDMETFDEVLVENTNAVHGRGQEGRQAVLPLAQHDAHARLDVPVAEVPGDDEQQDQLRPGRSRHGADGRRRRRPHEAPRRHRRGRQHHRSSSPPTTAPKCSPGRTAASRRSRPPRAPSWKAASACRASLAGRATSSRARSKTASSPAWIGSPPCSPPPAIRTSPTSCSRASSSATGPTRTTSTATTSSTCCMGKGPSKRAELFYFGGPQLGAVRIDDFKFQFFQQPHGWPGPKGHDRHAHHREHPPGSRSSGRPDRSAEPNDRGGGYVNDFYAREFWRFVLVQKKWRNWRRRPSTTRRCRTRLRSTSTRMKKQIDAVIRSQRGQ